MNVYDLIEALHRLPEDTVIVIHHELIGDEHELNHVEYDDKNGVLILHEID